MAPATASAAEGVRSGLLESLDLVSASEKVEAALSNATEGRVP